MLEFENSPTVNINMSSLQGHIKTTYDKLVKTFGEPTFTWRDACALLAEALQYAIARAAALLHNEYGSERQTSQPRPLKASVL